jgi:phospholipase/carboxylesterase
MRLGGLSACVAIALAVLPVAGSENAPAAPAWDLQAKPAAHSEHYSPSPGAGMESLPGMAWAKVYVPKSYDPAKRAPMALLLHGSGDRGHTMIRAFEQLAEERGVILLAPDSLAYSWDIMVAGARLRGVTRVPDWGPDVDRIDSALGLAFQTYAIDPDRVALIGFSDGAGYGLSLGANNADLFKTVVAFAPGLLMKVNGTERGRVMLVHGERDDVLPLKPTRDIFAPVLKNLGFDVELRTFNGGHVMPEDKRAEAFDWWLDGAKPGHVG